MSFTDWPAWWGFMGAVVYAAPKLTSCIYSGEHPRHFWRCVVETVTALLIGTISAASFVPWSASYLHANSPQDIKALAAMTGMLANSTAPGIIRFLSESVLTRIKGGH